MTSKSQHHFGNALDLRSKAALGQFSGAPVQAWARVVRECAKAESAFLDENKHRIHGTRHHAFLVTLDKIADQARAQVQALSSK